jgi:hypothetical protein
VLGKSEARRRGRGAAADGTAGWLITRAGVRPHVVGRHEKQSIAEKPTTSASTLLPLGRDTMQQLPTAAQSGRLHDQPVTW